MWKFVFNAFIILVFGGSILDLSDLYLFPSTPVFTTVQTYLSQQRNSSSNMDSFSFHFISEPAGLGGCDQSTLIEPDSTVPVRQLNKLLQLCSAHHLLSLLSPPFATFHPLASSPACSSSLNAASSFLFL